MVWEIEYFEDEDGSYPVHQVITALEVTKQAKIQQKIALLEELGPLLEYPNSSQVEGRLRELRVQYGRENYRIFYYGDRHRRFVLLHAIIKRTAKLPVSDVKVALRRMALDERLKRMEESEPDE